MKLVSRRDSASWEAECERLFTAEVDLSLKRIALSARIPVLVSTAGAAFLEGEAGTSGAANALDSSRSEMAMIDAALEVARNKRREALRQINVAEATKMRAEAARLRKKAEQHGQVTARLLAELQAHEGCDYVPYKPYVDPTGGDTVTYRIPTSASLEHQASGLEGKAEAKERQALRDWGELQGSFSPDELVENIVQLGPLMLGPSLVELHDWARSTLEGTSKERLRCRISWGNGEFAPTRSEAVLT